MPNTKVLFVCTGNTCRSPMAEGIYRALAKEKAESESGLAISRGIYAFDGDPASDHSIRALRSLWNIDISKHRAKMIDQNDVRESGLILAMTVQQREVLRQQYPHKKASIFTLKEYACPELAKNTGSLDIIDPYGMPYQEYERCAKEIYNCIGSLLKN